MLDRYFPNRVRRGEPLFPLCVATVAIGVAQVLAGLLLILSR